MGGQTSPSPTHLPADSVRSVYSSWLSSLGGIGRAEISIQISTPGRDLNPELHEWQSSTLTTTHPFQYKQFVIKYNPYSLQPVSNSQFPGNNACLQQNVVLRLHYYPQTLCIHALMTDLIHIIQWSPPL